MQTVSDWKTAFQKGAKDTSDASWDDFGLNQCNIGLHLMEADFGILEQERVRQTTTAIDTPTIELPEDLIRLKKLYLTIDDRRITPKPVFDDDLWQQILSYDNNESDDYAEYYMVRDNYVELYPQPTTAQVATFIYQGSCGDLYYLDDSTGTVALTNGSTAITGTSTTWDSTFVGRWIKPPNNNYWYQIASVTNTTTATLRKKYQGKTVTGATCRISELPYTLPMSAQHLPVKYALEQYYLYIRRDVDISKMYASQFKTESEVQKGLFKKRNQSVVIPSQNKLRHQLGGWTRHNLTRNLE